MDLGLSGKKVIVTGASKGLGEGIAEAFAREGANLHLVARSADKLGCLAERLRSDCGVAVTTQAVDITASGAVESIAEAAPDVDILINNAGAVPAGNLWTVDARSWREGWALKVFGYIDLTRVIYSVMRSRGNGVILNNIGNGGEIPDFDYVAVGTANAGLMAFTCALGGRSVDDGIRVVGINPGAVATDRINRLLHNRALKKFGDSGRTAELLREYPMGRVAEVSEVADLFVFLASPRSSYTSGAIIRIDGGFAARRSI